MKVTLVQFDHYGFSGQTDANVNHTTDGTKEDTALNETGRCQAKLAGVFLQNQSFDLVYSSPLARAHETAKIILENNKNPDTAQLEIYDDRALMERNFGVYEGRPREEFRAAVKASGKRLHEVSAYPARPIHGFEWHWLLISILFPSLTRKVERHARK